VTPEQSDQDNRRWAQSSSALTGTIAVSSRELNLGGRVVQPTLPPAEQRFPRTDPESGPQVGDAGEH
jgi:hypothetical protein